MKLLIVSLALAICGCMQVTVHATGVFYENNTGSAKNARMLLVTTTAQRVTLTTNLNKTLVAVNDDPENTIYYGTSTCAYSLGQKIGPGERVVFTGVTTGYEMYVCTASGSAELRLVEHY